MKYGFYIIQFENKDIKVESISYIGNPIVFQNIIKAEYLGHSIADFIKEQRITSTHILTDRLMKSINLSKFTVDERMRIKDLIKNFIDEYIQ